MKLVHSIVTKPELLWVQVLQARYGGREGPYRTSQPRNVSYLWKNLHSVWDDTIIALKWAGGRNGNTIRFWDDSWVGDLGPLSLLSSHPLTDSELQRPLSSFVDVLMQIRKMSPPQITIIPDQLYWSKEGSREFSVKSTYRLITEDRWSDSNPQRNLAWGWPGVVNA